MSEQSTIDSLAQDLICLGVTPGITLLVHSSLSSLGWVYELGGQVLLLGVGYDRNTSLHLAEYRADFAGKHTVQDQCPVIEEGQRVWKSFQDIEYGGEDFPALGLAFEADGGARVGAVGNSVSRLIDQKALVDYAVRWFEAHRLVKPTASSTAAG